jgi:tripeptidyl-peptidase-1
MFLLFLAAVVSLAAPTQHYELHERRDVIPSTWTEGEKLDGKVSMPVRIGLTQSNLDYGHELLMDLYVTLFLYQHSPKLTI